jgi:hypothetical protein
VVAGAAALAIGLLGAVGSTTSATAGAGEPAPSLIELASCAAPTPLPATTDERSDGATQVSFQVPAVVQLRVGAGRVTAAATNTGCAPRATDRFVVGDRLATAGESAAALAAFRTGDWRTPGVRHDAG